MKCRPRSVGGGKPCQRGTEAMLRRHELTDDQWDAIKELLPGKEGDPGVPARDNRLFMNAIFFIAKTGIPWRDPYDRAEYKERNVVERFINVLKQSRRVATRYEKTARNFVI